MTWQHDIQDVADALTEPHIHREPIHEWDHNRNRKLRHHQTIQPGLLTQLYQSVIPTWTTTDNNTHIPTSRPPLAVEALSTHDQIATDVLRWCTTSGLQLRVSVESNIRQLTAKAQTFDDETGRALLTELRRWRRWCLVLTGWEQVRVVRKVPCPIVECGRTGSLRINLTTGTALCHACGATWAQDDGSLGILAAHVEAFTPKHAASPAQT